MSTTEVTFDEFIDSLTGFDELAIKNHTKLPLSKLLASDELHASRAVIALHKLKEESQPNTPKGYAAAYKAAMEMPFKEVRTYFAEDPADVDPDDPDSESGKGDSPSDGKTTS